MGVDFNRLFGVSFRYPFKKDVYLVFFLVQIIFGLVSWSVMGYLGGELFEPDGTLIMENMTVFISYVLPIALVGWVVTAFLLPAYLENSAHFYKGKRKKILESFEVSGKRFVPTLAIFVILGLILLACMGGLILLAASASVLLSPEGLTLLAVGVIWLFVGAVAGIVVVFMTFLSPVLCSLENDRPLDSIKKSWRLVNKNKVNTLIFLMIFIVAYLAIAVAGSVPEIAFLFFYGQPAALSLENLVLMVIRTAVNAYLLLFMVSSAAGYYLSIKKTAKA